METTPKHPKVARIFGELLAALDTNATKLARDISRLPEEEYKQQTISNYVAGKFLPGQEILAAIARQYPAIDYKWLITGEGEPFPNGRYNEKPAPLSKDTEKQEAAEAPLVASRGGLPTPGEATPQQADFVGKLIQRLETELAGYQEREVWYQDMLKKPSPAPDATWLPAPAATPISLRPAACIPTNAQAGGKVLALWPAVAVVRAQA